MAGIAREVLPATGKRALNKFLTEYNWDEQQVNHERLDELHKHGVARRSKDSYIILDDTITQKAGDESGVCIDETGETCPARDDGVPCDPKPEEWYDDVLGDE